MKKLNKKLLFIIVTIILICVNQKILAKEKTLNEYANEGFYIYENLETNNEINKDIEKHEKKQEQIKNNIKIEPSIGNKAKAISKEQVNGAEDVKYASVYGNTTNIYVQADMKNDYIITNHIILGSGGKQYYEIVRHNIKENRNEVIYTSKSPYINIAEHVKGSIIYIAQVPYKSYDEGDYNEIQIIGFDVLTNKVVYEGTFATTYIQADYFPSFAVDGKQRFYFIYNYTGTKVFDNKGNLIFDKKPADNAENIELRIHSITPNDKGMIFSLNSRMNESGYIRTQNKGYQALKEDGSFAYPDLYTVYSQTSSYYEEDPDWKFLDKNGVYAVNQYGQIAKFNYIDYTEQNKCGLKIDIIDDIMRTSYDSSAGGGHLDNPAYFIKDNYLYLLGQDNVIFAFDMNQNFKRIGKINTGITTNPDYILYDNTYRITNIDDSIYIKFYEGSSNTIFERKINLDSVEEFKNIWVREHSTQKHTKNQIIEKYNNALPKFDYSKSIFTQTPSYKSPYLAGKLQDGVVTDTLNQINYFRWLYGVNEVTINTEKMERSQKGGVIQAALDKLTHYPSKPSDMDDNFYSEARAACGAGSEKGDRYNGNCAWGDKSPTDTISGFISDLNNVTIGSYVGHRLNLLDLDVSKTSFGYCNRYTALSMYYEGDTNNNEKFYSYPSAGNFPMQNFTTHEYWSFYCMDSYLLKDLKIEFTYNNKTYEQKEFDVENSAAIVFKMPQELINLLGGNNKRMPKAIIHLKLTGLINTQGDTINYEYDVNFFDINEVAITGISFTNKEQIGNVDRIMQAQSIKIVPSNATEEYKIVWSSSNTNVATIDANGKITCKNMGTTVITAKVGKYTATYTLTVKEKLNYVLGDVNKDGKIDVFDARIILRKAASRQEFTADEKNAGDVNVDGAVNVLDARRILMYSAKIISAF